MACWEQAKFSHSKRSKTVGGYETAREQERQNAQRHRVDRPLGHCLRVGVECKQFDLGPVIQRELAGKHGCPEVTVAQRGFCVDFALDIGCQLQRVMQNGLTGDPRDLQIEDEGRFGLNPVGKFAA